MSSNNPFAAFPAFPCTLLFSLYACSFSLANRSCLLSPSLAGLTSAAGLTLCTGGELPTSYPSTMRDVVPVFVLGGAKLTGGWPRAPIGTKGSRLARTKTGARDGEEMVMFGTRCATDSISAEVDVV